MNNQVIKSAIASLILLAAMTINGVGADTSKGVGADTSKSVIINGNFHNINGLSGVGLGVAGSLDHRFPDKSYLTVVSWSIYQPNFYCHGSGDTVADLVVVSPNASQGSLQVDISLLNCSSSPNAILPLPKTVTMNCLSNQHYSESYVSNGVTNYHYAGITYKYHSISNYSTAECTVMFDGVNLDYNGGYADISHTQYVNKEKGD